MFKVTRTMLDGTEVSTTFRNSTRDEIERWVDTANQQFEGSFEITTA